MLKSGNSNSKWKDRRSPSIEREMTFNTALNAHERLLKEAKVKIVGREI